MLRPSCLRPIALPLILMGIGSIARAAEPSPGRLAQHITLKNGFDLLCDHRAADQSIAVGVICASEMKTALEAFWQAPIAVAAPD